MRKILYVIVFIPLLFSSCNNSELKHDALYNKMRSYIYSKEDDVYGFEEVSRVAQKATALSRDTDIYILQDNLKDAVNQRLAIVAHTYFVRDAWTSNQNRTLLEIDGKDLRTCPNPEYASLYLTQDEIDYANRLYYSSIPDQLENIKEMESRKFNGIRYFYGCKYRKKMSDRYILKSFIVYENNKEYEIYELKYDYELLRSYVRAISNVDLKDPYVVSIRNKKYGWESNDMYRSMINRLNIDILDYSPIRGY